MVKPEIICFYCYNFANIIIRDFIFEGSTINGKKQGKGKLFYPNGKLMFDGEFYDDKICGNGVMYLDNGGRYEGVFENNLPNGKGKYYDLYAGLRCEGDWVDGYLLGFGTIYYLDGYKYIGDLKDNRPYGTGKLFFNEVVIYDGEWANGYFNGYGEYLYNHQEIPLSPVLTLFKVGEKYKGQFKKSYADGKGKLYYSDGKLMFVGNFIKGCREGFGVLFTEDGKVVKGKYKNDEIID